MKKLNLLILLFVTIASFQSYGCSGKIRKANKEIRLYDYTTAINILKQVVDQNDPKTIKQATALLAECYRKKNDFPEAVYWYGKVISLGSPDTLHYLYYANALRSMGEYDKAAFYYRKYDSLVPGDHRGKKFAEFCDNAKSWGVKEPGFETRNVKVLNSSFSEFGPVLYDQEVYFTSDRFTDGNRKKVYGWTGHNYLRIYSSKVKNGQDLSHDFSAPAVDKEPVNSEYHNGPVCFDVKSNIMYINRTYRGKSPRDTYHIREDLLKIFYSTKENDIWTKPQPFPYNSDKYSVGHPAVSPEGTQLYFVSDMPGGYGGTDIYVSSLIDGKWSKPVNLGQKVNTFGNEMFPSINEKGDLFFASDGLPGFGSLDIYVSHKKDNEFQEPVNMGRDINSSYDDFSLVSVSPGSGLFCSNRPGGAGEDDIYMYKEIPPLPPKYFVSGCVKDKMSNQPIPDATVFLLNEKDGKISVVKTNESGCFKTEITLGISYRAKAMQAGYIADCGSFTFDVSETKTDLSAPRVLLLDKLAVNRKFKLDNIYYDFDKWNIRSDAEPSLNVLITIMKENKITVELGSHTDCRGSKMYNEKLSQRRAESAVQYIISKGISSSRITAKGYGESEPVNQCVDGVKCSQSQHQDNRRTEFKVISLDVTPVVEAFDPAKYKDGDLIDSKELPDSFFKECK